MPLTAIALFNPQGGYATYILPAALVLLLQQTLLIGVGLLGTMEDERSQELAGKAGPLSRVSGKLVAYLLVETPIFAFYLVALPYLYGIPRLGSIAAIAVISIPFVVAVAGLGMIVARVLKNPVAVQLVFAGIGVPFLFLSGFSWPGEAIPEPLGLVALAVPSTTAINAIVEVAQLGASVADIADKFAILLLQAAVYLAIASMMEASYLRQAVLRQPRDRSTHRHPAS